MDFATRLLERPQVFQCLPLLLYLIKHFQKLAEAKPAYSIDFRALQERVTQISLELLDAAGEAQDVHYLVKGPGKKSVRNPPPRSGGMIPSDGTFVDTSQCTSAPHRDPDLEFWNHVVFWSCDKSGISANFGSGRSRIPSRAGGGATMRGHSIVGVFNR